MIKKSCSLERASMYFGGGGGGGTDINQLPGGFRNWGNEQKDIGKSYDFNIGRGADFRDNDRLLGPATTGALSFWDQLPSLLSQFTGFGNQLSGYQGQLGNFSGGLRSIGNQLGGLIPRAGRQISQWQSQLGDIYGNLGGQANTLGSWLGQVQPTIDNHGALTAEGERDVAQRTRQIFSQQGNVGGNAALGTELLNREGEQERRFNQALQQGQGLLGQQQGVYGAQAGVTGQQGQMTALGNQITSGLLGQQAGIFGQRAGLTGMNAGLTGQRAGLLGQQQAVQTGGINQLLGVGNAATNQFSAFTTPMLQYLDSIFRGNQQAAVQQAGINAQQNAAGDAKGGSAVSAGGSIVGALIPVIAGL